MCMCVAGGQCWWRPKALQGKITTEKTQSRAFCATQEQCKAGLQTALVYSRMKWVVVVLQFIFLSCQLGCSAYQDLWGVHSLWTGCQIKLERPFPNVDFPKAKGQTKWICPSARWASWVRFLVLKLETAHRLCMLPSLSLAYTQVVQKLQDASRLLCPLSAFHLLTLLCASKYFL